MKRALIAAAAGAIGALGTAGLMSAAPASADDCSSFAVLQGRFVCIAQQNLQTFGDSINPVNQVNTFLHGTTDPDTGENDGLGILDQPSTFIKSVGSFLGGPYAP
ncbi:MAG TPA: hypothetical protein VMS92_11065 [Mycobacterium sp.]|nr:hypothetical protein [Mycobacterium sp.]